MVIDDLLQRCFKSRDILVGCRFGYRDDQAILQLTGARIEPAQRNAPENAPLNHGMHRWPGLDRKHQGEFIEKTVVDELNPRDRGEPVRRLTRARVIRGSELPQALLAQKRQMNREGQGAKD
jgi:hypothetical protein